MANEAPHDHALRITDCDTLVSVVYGDTRELVHYWFKRFPSERRLMRAGRKVIAKHDRGSRRVPAKERALANVRNLRSDWYMDSPERMTKLHTQAIREDQDRQYRTTGLRSRLDALGPLPIQFQPDSSNTGHYTPTVATDAAFEALYRQNAAFEGQNTFAMPDMSFRGKEPS